MTFPEHNDLRPTGDRVRETLFNWLMHDIRGSDCLDLFAGSGVLSIEALSRGANHVTLIENNAAASSRISNNLAFLEASPNSFTNIKSNAIEWLGNCDTSFDLIFVDPPFASNTLPTVLELLATRRLARKFVYLETHIQIDTNDLPGEWMLYRQKHAGSVHYSLCITS
ncbi:16S rRNA (guanine(966)-N(2))-methyltransferase RsmD [Gammaproteobacteria bacterium]|nr:16S rRNA (guanine(966)-N(2))-methyltransferase RsmD [Gammaproteobacteria bacterium]